MNAVLLDRVPDGAVRQARDAHILLIAANQRARYTLADQLLEAGFRLTLASSYGLADLLIQAGGGIDLLITAERVEEASQIGLAQLARAVCPELPILVLDEESAAGPGVLDAVETMLRRWPVRDSAASQFQ